MGFEWSCSSCTYYHQAPRNRCVMCGNLRNASTQEMQIFVTGMNVNSKNSSSEVSKETPQQKMLVSTAANQNPASKPYNPYGKPKLSSALQEQNSKRPISSKGVQRDVELLPSYNYSQQHNRNILKEIGATEHQHERNVVNQPLPNQINSTNSSEKNLNTLNQQNVSSCLPLSILAPIKDAKIQYSPQIPPNVKVPSSIATSRYCNMYQPGPIPIDREAAKEWIFPVHPDYSLRDYQLEISQTAVQNNTLVSLPTGLGKTFIAAVVLYNYYRWFPHGGKVIFLAPTLPLVDQQVRACYDIMGIPAQDTAVLNGKVPAAARASLWRERRVFFCTPQTVEKDMEANRCPTSNVVCLVFDEAHKAVGNFAYTKIVELCEAAGSRCRILGLSATPGARVQQVQKVIDALRIARLETRTEEEVKDYIHERHNEIVVVKSRSICHDIERKFNAIIEPFMAKLRANTNIGNKIGANVATLTSYCIHKARQYHISTTSDHRCDGYFMAAQKLIDARANLFSHGIGSVRGKLMELQNTPQRGLLATVVKSSEFQDLVESVIAASSGKQHSQETAEDKRGNNPKLEKLEEILREHFHRATASGCTTRAIVFSQWRDSVSEIVDVLKISEPLIRPRYFVGQSSGSANKVGSTKGMPQKVQQKVIRDFQEGTFNVLVCTCIGEEGLDIGEVDLIVNYDTLRSPIRMIQRVGRTGRKRSGRVVCLVSEGQEQCDLVRSKNNEKSLQRALKRSDNFKLRPNLLVLPQEPKLVKQIMAVSEQLRLSQLGGHASTARPKKEISLEGINGNWKLSPHLESIRFLTFGKISSINATSFPVHLKRKLLRARLRSHSSSMDSDDTIAVNRGSKVTILKRIDCGNSSTCEIQVFKKHRAMERDCIGLFPLEKHENALSDRKVHADWDKRMSLTPNVSTNRQPMGNKSDNLKPMNSTASFSLKENVYTRPSKGAWVNDVDMAISELRAVEQIKENVQDRNVDNRETEVVSLRLPTPPTSSSEDEAYETEDDKPISLQVPAITCNSGIRLPTPPASSSDSEDDDLRGLQDKELVTISNIGTFGNSSSNSMNGVGKDHLIGGVKNDPMLHVDSPSSSPAHRLLLPTQDSSSDDESNKFDNDKGSDVLLKSDNGILVGKSSSEKKLESSFIDEQSFSSNVNQTPLSPKQVNNMMDGSFSIHDTAFVKASTLIQFPSLFLADTSPIKKDSNAEALTTMSSANCSKEFLFDESLDFDSQEIITKKTRNRANVIMTPQSGTNESSSFSCMENNAEALPDYDSPSRILQASPKEGAQCEGSQLVDTPLKMKVDLSQTQENDANDIVCAVCLCGDSSHADPIVLCDGALDVACDFAVHVSCYSLEKSVIDSLVEWRCDICDFKHVFKPQSLDLRCLVCQESGGLKRLDSSPHTLQWVHPYCMEWSGDSAERICEYCLLPGARKCGIQSCDRSAHPHCIRNLADDECWLVVVETDKRHSSIFCNIHRSEEHCKIALCPSDPDKRIPRCFILPSKRLKRYVSTKRDKPLDSFYCKDKARKARTDQGLITFEKRERIQQNIEKRRQLSLRRSKFIDDEAEIDSDEDIEGDNEELSDVRRIDEEEELAALDFINDSSQLGTYTQDALDRIDGHTEEEVDHDGVDFHRQLDFEHDRNLQFATPILNRRMVRRKLDTGDVEGCWSESQVSGSSRSPLHGLGNCHFIRSVLEHAKRGGDAEEIEILYKDIEQELELEESNSPLDAQRPIAASKPIILEYVPSDEEEEAKESCF